MADEKKFLTSETVPALVSAIKEKSDASYANLSDINIISIKVNGVEVTPIDKVVDISVITQDEVTSQIATAIGDIKEFNIEVVSTLPTENISTSTIYLVPNVEQESQNIYDEYIYIQTVDDAFEWEKIGSKTIDLTDYVAKEEGKGLSTNDYIDADKTKLEGIEEGAQVNTITSVAGKTGVVTLEISDINSLDDTLADKVSKSDTLTTEEIQTLVNNAWVD